MKRVLLVTLQGNHNYGNRLQNYALQTVIEQMGFRVDSAVLWQRLLRYPGMTRKLWNRRIRFLMGQKEFGIPYAKLQREVSCLRFSRRYLHRFYIPPEEVFHRDWAEYDFAVTGSDQVWHKWASKSLDDELAYYYLEFIESGKRISYAPSFGFSRFPEQDLETHRKGLMGMSRLSCRETEGCELIRELTGREAMKTFDPVLLLTNEDWRRIERRPSFRVKKPYLFAFFLGAIPQQYQREIERIKKEHGLLVINGNDLSEPLHYGISPSEFIWLINHASIVCTDSFHTSAFSVLFGTRLRVFPRVQENYEDMFGRIRDLLSPLGLMHLAYGEGDGSDLSTALSAEAKQYLEKERALSVRYLRESLHV